MRYFFGENAHRPIKVGSRIYSFEVVGHVGGTAQGVVAVKDEEAEAFLATAGKLGVREVNEESYNAMRAKKKRLRSQPVGVLRQASPRIAASMIPDVRGVAVAGGLAGLGLAQPSDGLPLSAGDAVTLQKIAADAPNAEPSVPRKPPQRQDRAPRGRRTQEDSANPAVVAGDVDAEQPAI